MADFARQHSQYLAFPGVRGKGNRVARDHALRRSPQGEIAITSALPAGASAKYLSFRRMRKGRLVVIDVRPDPRDFPGQELQIPGDGHPTGVANRARALLVRDALAGLTR